MYALVAEFKIKPDQVETFGRLIDQQARDSVGLEADCHQFDVCQAEDDPARFLLYELYTDKAAFDRHGGAAHTANFRAAVAPMLLERSLRGFHRR